eukprot:TRINITY_DN32730_c0_g1_i1.p1 TRINITY_DN32730_c0_g1~~TRINITY_DN32730_c0_g1_i1.p1  ORF type:complete len:797 (+),score=24.81 TRINITY_DN32730_c0_g1_i1:150-2540(+)
MTEIIQVVDIPQVRAGLDAALSNNTNPETPRRYWQGLRLFLLAKLSKQEWDAILTECLPGALVVHHNHFVIGILHNARVTAIASAVEAVHNERFLANYRNSAFDALRPRASTRSRLGYSRVFATRLGLPCLPQPVRGSTAGRASRQRPLTGSLALDAACRILPRAGPRPPILGPPGSAILRPLSNPVTVPRGRVRYGDLQLRVDATDDADRPNDVPHVACMRPTAIERLVQGPLQWTKDNVANRLRLFSTKEMMTRGPEARRQQVQGYPLADATREAGRPDVRDLVLTAAHQLLMRVLAAAIAIKAATHASRGVGGHAPFAPAAFVPLTDSAAESFLPRRRGREAWASGVAQWQTASSCGRTGVSHSVSAITSSPGEGPPEVASSFLHRRGMAPGVLPSGAPVWVDLGGRASGSLLYENASGGDLIGLHQSEEEMATSERFAQVSAEADRFPTVSSVERAAAADVLASYIADRSASLGGMFQLGRRPPPPPPMHVSEYDSSSLPTTVDASLAGNTSNVNPPGMCNAASGASISLPATDTVQQAADRAFMAGQPVAGFSGVTALGGGPFPLSVPPSAAGPYVSPYGPPMPPALCGMVSAETSGSACGRNTEGVPTSTDEVAAALAAILGTSVPPRRKVRRVGADTDVAAASRAGHLGNVSAEDAASFCTSPFAPGPFSPCSPAPANYAGSTSRTGVCRPTASTEGGVGSETFVGAPAWPSPDCGDDSGIRGSIPQRPAIGGWDNRFVITPADIRAALDKSVSPALGFIEPCVDILRVRAAAMSARHSASVAFSEYRL